MCIQESEKMTKGSNSQIRDRNTELILQTIVQEGQISRADLAKQLKLSKATVSTIVQELLDRSLVQEIGTGTVQVGRKPILLEFCADCGYVLSMDIQARTVSVLLADLLGGEIYFVTVPHHAAGAQILEVLSAQIERALEEAGHCVYGLIGVSLAINGVVHDREIRFTPYYDYENVDFLSLQRDYQVPVFIENEANLAALGERAFGITSENLVSLSIHSGTGLGLILNGELYAGAAGYAGEYGHTIIEIDGRPCPCGNRGCLEQYLSERAALEEYAKAKQAPEVNAATLCADYRRGDPDAEAVIGRFLRLLAVSIHNIQNTINPELIVVSSRITEALKETLPILLSMLPAERSGTCRVAYSSLKDRAPLLGGVYDCVNQQLGIQPMRLKKHQTVTENSAEEGKRSK